jgi:3-methyladenine DNA glycosylase AlkD
MTTVAQIQSWLCALGNPDAAAFAARYFKTGPGQYADGDRFHGMRVPVLRKLAREYQDIEVNKLMVIFRSELHEDRLLALLILVLQFRKGDSAARTRIFDLYLRSTKFINNWDLVDGSCREIVGSHLHDGDRSLLARLVDSELFWERRIAIISTGYFIQRSARGL